MSCSLWDAVSALMRMWMPVSLMNSSLYSRRNRNFLFIASRSVLCMPDEVDAGSLVVVGLDLMVSSLIISLAVVRFEVRSSSSSSVGRPK